MNNLRQYIQKKDVVELIALLTTMMLVFITAFFTPKYVQQIIIGVYALFLVVFLIKHFWEYSVLDKQGRISMGMFIFSLIAKAVMMRPVMEVLWPQQGASVTIVVPVMVTLLLSIYLIIIIAKKAYGEIFNTVIYYLPLIFLWLFR